MSDCCSTTNQTETTPTRLACPACQHKGAKVALKTMLHHIKQPYDQAWLRDVDSKTPTSVQYYYCANPDCDTVYFATHGHTLSTADIRTEIGIKSTSAQALICYCFGVSKAEAAANKKAKDFVIAQTRQANCSCETANPSGRCCLKDFPE